MFSICISITYSKDNNTLSANLARWSEVRASSAVWRVSLMVLTDGLLDTCFSTRLEDDPWITVTLPRTYLVEGVILRIDYTKLGMINFTCFTPVGIVMLVEMERVDLVYEYTHVY